MRTEAVRRLLAAARALAADATLVPALAESTGLSRAGVEWALEHSLEKDATDLDLAKLFAAAGEAKVVHVILASNVFVAPLRAIALARAAAPRVVVRPSRREPLFARALVEAAGDPAITLAEDLVVAQIDEGEIHVYGRDETIAEVRARARVPVRSHGAGMGVAVVGPGADAARDLATVVAAFDQRGCLSPRIALVEGDAPRFAAALHHALSDCPIPRGALYPEERAESTRFRQALEFAGEVHLGTTHMVGVLPAGAPLVVPPPGRHVLVAPFDAAAIARFARFIVAAGTTDPARHTPRLPAHARISTIAAMQSPPLDGPVDRRP